MNNAGLSYIAEEALIQVAVWLEGGGKHVRINSSGRVIDSFNMETSVDNEPECGTSCCIAGAVAQFNGLGKLDVMGDMEWTTVKQLVSDFLGMTRKDVNYLFTPWVMEAFEEYDPDNLEGMFNNPALGAKVIRNYLATGIIDWEIDA